MADFLAISFALIVAAAGAYFVNEFYLDRPFLGLQGPSVTERLIEFSVLTMLLLIMFGGRGHYSSRHPFWTEARDVSIAVLIFAMADSSLQFAFKDQPSRLWLILTWVAAIPLLLLGRIMLRRILLAAGMWNLRTLMIGEGEAASNAIEALQSEAYLGYNVVAHTAFSGFDPDSDNAAENDSHLTRSGGSVGHAVMDLVTQTQAQFIVLAPSPDQFGKLDQLVRHLDRWHMSYAVVPPLRGISLLSLEPQHFYSHDLMMLTFRSSLTSPAARALKRSFDLVVSSLLALFLAPLFLALAAAVKWDGGPALFRQKRVGKNGQIFECLKFRSMVVDADKRLADLLQSDTAARAEWDREHKLKNDPRITRIGDFLRRTSFDELPQIFNVLKGEMSLVGPRPIVQDEVAKYGDNIDYYLSAAPGITGLWQVSGRNDTTYKRRVELDRWYIQNWSLWQDIAILFKTIPAVMSKDGAY